MTTSAIAPQAGKARGAEGLFSQSIRVIYAHAPLTQVVCQFRYPPILKIGSALPADFQERVRAEFPTFEANAQNLPLVPPVLPAELSEMLAAQFGGGGYKFRSEDGTNSIDLNSNFVGLTTTKYTRWELFRSTLNMIRSALVDIYRPAYFSRIGLRYVNIINRNSVGLADVPWSKLLGKHVVGELSATFIEENIDELQRFVRVRLPDGGVGFLLQNGLVKDPSNSRSSYKVDFDFYNDFHTEIDRAEFVADQLHSLSGRAFRWAISDELHSALGPQPVD